MSRHCTNGAAHVRLPDSDRLEACVLAVPRFGQPAADAGLDRVDAGAYRRAAGPGHSTGASSRACLRRGLLIRRGVAEIRVRSRSERAGVNICVDTAPLRTVRLAAVCRSALFPSQWVQSVADPLPTG